MRTILPGEPATHAEQNAKAHIDDIVGLWRLSFFDPATDSYFADVDPHAKDVADDYGWNVPEMTAADLQDAITQAVSELPLSVRYMLTWNAGEKPNTDEPEEMEVVLTTGGPSLWITCAFGYDQIICDPAVYCSEAGTGQIRYSLSSDEQLAVQWMLGVLAA